MSSFVVHSVVTLECAVSRSLVSWVQFVLRKVSFSRLRQKSFMVVSVGRWSLMLSLRTLKE